MILHSAQTQGSATLVKGLGGAETLAYEVMVTLTLGKAPPFQAMVLAAAIGEYILGIDVLRGHSVDTQYGLFAFGHPRYVSAMRARKVRTLTIMRGSPRWEPVVLPPPIAVVSKKQYRLPGGEEEMTQTINALLEAKIIRPALSPYNSPLWPVRKPDGTWHMTVDYQELNKVTPPLMAVIPDMVTLIEHIAAAAQPWHAILDLANAFFSIAIALGSQEQFTFSWQAHQYTFCVLLQGWKHSPTICHQLVSADLARIQLPPLVHHYYYIDDVMVSGPSREVVADALHSVVEGLEAHGWSLNLQKIQGPAQTVIFLGIMWAGPEQQIPQKGAEPGYTPLEKQILAVVWALQDTKRVTGPTPVVVHMLILLGRWVREDPAPVQTGVTQNATHFKWKHYLQQRMPLGWPSISIPHAVLLGAITFEHVPSLTDELPPVEDPVLPSPVGEAPPVDQLPAEEWDYAWFMDGSAPNTAQGIRQWRAIAYTPYEDVVSMAWGTAGSSQWAELRAATLAIEDSPPQAYIYVDSWALYKGLRTWVTAWDAKRWELSGRPLWGTALWQQLLHYACQDPLAMRHVDAHTKAQTAEAHWKAAAYDMAREDVMQLTERYHVKGSHRGAHATQYAALCQGLTHRSSSETEWHVLANVWWTVLQREPQAAVILATGEGWAYGLPEGEDYPRMASLSRLSQRFL
ncbi:uncharacterized protein LOC142046889 [Chelonoidis abingdonii]|uniref:uncharacterized protein LOC142046889 n=1 Tax=Chelonoidis abingdonii TaxID=106734 RepID=UPI003F4905C9